MVLTIKERLLLLQILPREGPAAALRIRQRVALQPKEVQKIGLAQDGEVVKWDTSIASEIEFLPTVRQALYLSDLVEKMNKQGNLNVETMLLFDRFYLPTE